MGACPPPMAVPAPVPPAERSVLAGPAALPELGSRRTFAGSGAERTGSPVLPSLPLQRPCVNPAGRLVATIAEPVAARSLDLDAQPPCTRRSRPGHGPGRAGARAPRRQP